MKTLEETMLPCCDIRIYDDLSLPMIMLQGWFSDRHDCFQLFLKEWAADEQVDFAKLVEPLEDYYCRANGRPVIHPEVLVRGLLISS